MRGYPLKLPFWSGGGAAYSHKVSLFEPIPLNSALVLYEIGARINAAAEIKEHLAVRTLPAAYKENRGVGEGKAAQLRVTVCNPAADGVVYYWKNPVGPLHSAYMVAQLLKLIGVFCGLGEDVNWKREIYLCKSLIC